jgi:serine/threonine protein phosphatase 1
MMPFSRIIRRRDSSTGLSGAGRIYAIGDIHGRLDLLYDLIDLLHLDARSRPPLRNRVVILGDFIDRGPDSRQLIELLNSRQSADFIVLKGNHEAALLDALRGDIAALDLWMQYGGDATLRSFDVAEHIITSDDPQMLVQAARKAIPKRLVKWMDSLPLYHRAGPYFFVHAGIVPGVPLARQSAKDMLWIRQDFTDSPDMHEAMIVHGHTVYEEGVFFASNRIGVDTGAYRTGKLSAVGIEIDARWAISTSDEQIAVIACPQCAARFRLLKKTNIFGKRFRCAQCDHRWQA